MQYSQAGLIYLFFEGSRFAWLAWLIYPLLVDVVITSSGLTKHIFSIDRNSKLLLYFDFFFFKEHFFLFLWPLLFPFT